MAAPSKVRSGVGVRDFQIFVLDATGAPAATSTAAYAGIDVGGIHDMTVNDPEPRLISHYGDDHVFQLDSLPPTETLTGELVVSKVNDTLDEALTGNKSFTAGEWNLIGVNTDLKGLENNVGALVYQQSRDTDPSSSLFGTRTWSFKIMPVVNLIPREEGMSETPTAFHYTMRPAFVAKHLWGVAFTTAVEGFKSAQLIRGHSQYKPRVVAFKADGSTTTFTLGQTAVSTSKITVYDYTAGTTAAVTATTTSVVFTTAPTTDHIIVATFEVSNTASDEN
jgi:hypothetical protein